MAQVNISHLTPSGAGMAMFGVPLVQGRAEFREWIAEQMMQGMAGEVSYGWAVRMQQEGELGLYGTFGGVEVHFYTMRDVVGAILFDPATMKAWWACGLENAMDVRAWADELGLNPQFVGGR